MLLTLISTIQQERMITSNCTIQDWILRPLVCLIRRSDGACELIFGISSQHKKQYKRPKECEKDDVLKLHVIENRVSLVD